MGYLEARPAAEFLGRAAALARLGRLAALTARGGSCLAGVGGPRGAGKSELLKQFAAAEQASLEVLPLYVDLATLGAGHESENGGRGGQLELRQALFRRVLGQILARAGRLEVLDTRWLEADPAHLSGFCYGAGYTHLAPFATQGRGHLSLCEAWRGLLRAIKAQGLPPPFLLLDGAAESGTAETGVPTEPPAGANGALLPALLEGARREDCAVVFEAPADLHLGFANWLEGLEMIELGLLELTDAVQLAQTVAQRRTGRAAPSPAILGPILTRLGPWPGWVRAWAAQARLAPAGGNPVRAAEEAYVDFISAGPWADDLRRRFDRLAALPQRERALRLVRLAADRSEALSAEEAPLIFGASDAETDRLVCGLERLGLLQRRGSSWSGPALPVLTDWAALALAESHDPAGPAAARLALLSRLLAQPRAEELCEPVPSPADLLVRFSGQAVSTVLFDYGYFYEAVGRLSFDLQRQTVLATGTSLTLPEVIGVAEWKPRPGAGDAPRFIYARAYREGRYQRSHEEIWIAVDLSAVRMLTTPEIEETLRLTRALEDSLRPGRFVRWFIIGQGASAEAVELIRREGLYCSGGAQLRLLGEVLAPPVPRDLPTAAPEGSGAPPLDLTVMPIEPVEAAPRPVNLAPAAADPPLAAASPLAVRDEIAPPVAARQTVIDLARAGTEPRQEASNLSLPAREGSEVIAALAAEKIAIRADFDLGPAGQIKTSVLEGVLNAIEHSPNTEKLIDIQFLLKPEALEILIENEGPSFDPLTVPPPDPRQKLGAPHKRGWGLSLMKRFMDEVGYEPCARGTRLRLIKKRALAAGVAEPPVALNSAGVRNVER